ncbi:HU family DNA-binding protein [Pseudoalteromonas mariniglutinosa]|uniref:HU family DNA-binding protein n=1 Tax=Pseudoalteromonas mariniglutinosa TaxID=206042 RepID=UPI00384CF240
MNRTQLVTVMAEKSALTKKDTQAFIASFQKMITQSLAEGDQVQITGFGTFALSYYPARAGRNPQTGATIEIAGANKAIFKPAKALKEQL